MGANYALTLILPNILHSAFTTIALRYRRELALEVSEECEFFAEIKLSANFSLNEIVGGTWASNTKVRPMVLSTKKVVFT